MNKEKFAALFESLNDDERKHIFVRALARLEANGEINGIVDDGRPQTSSIFKSHNVAGRGGVVDDGRPQTLKRPVLSRSGILGSAQLREAFRLTFERLSRFARSLMSSRSR